MAVESKVRTNWWGLASTIGLFIWFLFWFKNEPRSVNEQILLWGPLALIHWFPLRRYPNLLKVSLSLSACSGHFECTESY
jgi:hypothetical protein